VTIQHRALAGHPVDAAQLPLGGRPAEYEGAKLRKNDDFLGGETATELQPVIRQIGAFAP